MTLHKIDSNEIHYYRNEVMTRYMDTPETMIDSKYKD